jgi:hypothetical protein
MTEVTATRVLTLFAKHERSASICCAIRTTFTIGSAETVVTSDEYLDEATVQAHAEGRGRTTWDEDDLCALLDVERDVDPEPVA